MRKPQQHLGTHEVFNQSGPLPDRNLFASDEFLKAAVAREGAGWAEGKLHDLGAVMGRQETLALADDANRFAPELHSHDRFGRRIDQVSYHPAYHALMDIAISHEIHAIAWTAERGGHVAHAALEYLFAQVEGGVCCPVTMTYAAVPTLRQSEDLERDWLPRLLTNRYDSRFVPAAEKHGVTLGMAMTEKQGGSDLRGNTTSAEPLEGPWHALTGHKWFCSAPMSDAFLTLARTTDGLTCFLVPRWRPDGERNPFYIQRLKHKLGNHSNASAEIEYDRTWGHQVGEPGRGIATIMSMVQHTRLDTCLAPVALMRSSLCHAYHHALHREAFGRRLVDQPLMRAVLADLTLELEAAVNLVFRVGRAFDDGTDENGRAFARLASALAKFYLNKLAPVFVCEALEVFGGGGYVEENPLARFYREAPLNGIWEGSGNVICLDVLRTAREQPAVLTFFFGELDSAAGFHPKLDKKIKELRAWWLAAEKEEDLDALQRQARYVTESMARAWQAKLLVHYGQDRAAATFCERQLGEAQCRTYGASPQFESSAFILQRLESQLYL